jgi:hypothetical protein
VTSFNPLPSLFYLSPKEREVSGWPELDLKDFLELGLDLLENLPHRVKSPGPRHQLELTAGPLCEGAG